MGLPLTCSCRAAVAKVCDHHMHAAPITLPIHSEVVGLEVPMHKATTVDQAQALHDNKLLIAHSCHWVTDCRHAIHCMHDRLHLYMNAVVQSPLCLSLHHTESVLCMQKMGLRQLCNTHAASQHDPGCDH